MKDNRPIHLALAAALALLLVFIGGAPAAAAAAGHVLIEGTGSSWSANAINQWTSAVKQTGLQVEFTPIGSAAGRKDFAYGSNDFAVTDIPYQGRDEKTGVDDTSSRPYAYLPIVAGGTSFPYQVRVGGQLVKDLRLSGETLAKIFMNKITNWNDPQIASDNNGRKLPSLPITPVVHQEGSGSTAQFTAYLAKMFPSMWQQFSGRTKLTEYFPAQGRTISQNGSDGVMNYIVSRSGNGAIGYDEYSYPLGAGFPVVKLENAAGYFTLPTDFNVAVSLTQAVINNDKNSNEYLIQNLDNVYVYGDKRTYPLSSYSYMVLPVGTDAQDQKMSTAKRQTLADFLSYVICVGQDSVGSYGYSPLPGNLVKSGFEQVQKLQAADPGVSVQVKPLETCNNPTFVPGQPDNLNHLAQIAPMPPECDKVGQFCVAGAAGSGSGSGGSGGNGSGGGGSGSGGTGAAGGAAGAGASASANPSAGAGGQVDPDTGSAAGGDGGGSNPNAIGTPTDLASFIASRYVRILSGVAALLLIAVLFVPAILTRRFGAKPRGRQ
jgi:phosphate transport system substrate-binding protein